MNNMFTIYFEQSGGFAGMTIKVVLNNKVLSRDEFEHVHILIEQADFFSLQTDKKDILFLISFCTEYHRNCRPQAYNIGI